MEALKLLQCGESFQSVSKRLRIVSGELKTWSLIYEKEGDQGLAAHPKNVCTSDIKSKIICTYQKVFVPLHRFLRMSPILVIATTDIVKKLTFLV